MNAVPETLVRRAAIVRAIRAFFDGRGFTEVETATRVDAPAPEPHIDCPPVATGGFLRASPELQMKKLLAAGMDRIYQIGPCFRDGERGTRHNPEFTMIEWYRRDATCRDIQRDLTELLAAFEKNERFVGFEKFEGLEKFERCGKVETWTVRAAYRKHAGWDPWTDWDADRFDFDMATKIEPAIKARGGGVFLTDYPTAAASLALVSGAGADAVAERWEFYWDGLELANCFTELCDAPEQRRRFLAARDERRALGERDYPIDEAFLASLPAIDRAAGVALGVDRLVMKLLGLSDIQSVRAAV